MDSGLASSMRPGMPTEHVLARAQRLAPGLAPCGPLRVGAKFSCGIKVIWVVQSFPEKYSASRKAQINSRTPAIPSHTEGRFAIVTDVGHGMRWTRQRRRAIVIAGRGPTRER